MMESFERQWKRFLEALNEYPLFLVEFINQVFNQISQKKRRKFNKKVMYKYVIR